MKNRIENLNRFRFVWIDSFNRLVELQNPPWSQHCILRVISTGRCREHKPSLEIIPRLSYLLSRVLVRVAIETQRLSTGLGLCSRHEVRSAFNIVLSPGKNSVSFARKCEKVNISICL